MKPDEDFIRIGVVAGAHGISGHLKIFMTTSFPDRFKKGNRVLLKNKTGETTYTIAEFRQTKGKYGIACFEGISNRNEADLIKGSEIVITRDEAEKAREILANEEFLYSDLIDCEVYLKGNHFGRVIEISDSGGGEILIIKSDDNRDCMIPFVVSMVDTARIREKRIDISPVEGLFDI